MTWFEKKTLVVPVDLSDPSLSALDEALAMADSTKQIHVIHVIQDAMGVGPEFAMGVIDVEVQIREAKQALHDRFNIPRYDGITVEVRYGDPGIEIAQYAEEIKADAIIMPSHGRRGLKRLLIGSVAERVVRLAHCPVFVLKS
jgi:nucleotide-binding universal stress UspA family protein